MNISEVGDSIHRALAKVGHARFFENERGFQGELSRHLHEEMKGSLVGNEIFEEEHQKTTHKHNLKLRPDLILHVPFDPEEHESRCDGNKVVILLKRRATERTAKEQIRELKQYLNVLQYRIGVFVNIDSSRVYPDALSSEDCDRIICFAVYKEEGQTIVCRW